MLLLIIMRIQLFLSQRHLYYTFLTDILLMRFESRCVDHIISIDVIIDLKKIISRLLLIF